MPVYPVLLVEESARRTAALAAWAALTKEQGLENVPDPQLYPVTATIKGFPEMPGALYLPKIGEAPPMSEDEAREALRQFIVAEKETLRTANLRALLGTEPQELSLVLRTNLADGNKRARYQQQPFRFPLRGGFGVLEITFAPNGRIIDISSTCIPDTDSVRRILLGFQPRFTAGEIEEQLAGRTFAYTDESGIEQSYTVQSENDAVARELVVLARYKPNHDRIIEFYLAWEIILSRDRRLLGYVDSTTGQIITALSAGNSG